MVNHNEIGAYGLKVLLGNHKDVRRLKKSARPLEHGHKVWTSSWLLIDYLQFAGIEPGTRLLDLGCGWGLAGIFSARKLKANVVWADIDGLVLPYLELMAHANRVNVNFKNLGIEQFRRSLLERIDIIVAADICFCDSMIDPLRRLINRAKAAGTVKQILIADPGRWPFEDLSEIVLKSAGAAMIEHQIDNPKMIQGKILKITL